MVSHEGMRVMGHDPTRSQSTNRILDEPRWCLRPIHAVLNCLNHLIELMPYTETPNQPVVMPPRHHHEDYHRHPVPEDMVVPQKY